MDCTAVLKKLYNDYTGHEASSVEELPSSGSNRRYFRLNSAKSVNSLIGVIGTCKEENEAFLYLDRHFCEKGISVPKVLAASDDNMAYLQEDMGDTLLFNAIEKGRLTS